MEKILWATTLLQVHHNQWKSSSYRTLLAHNHCNGLTGDIMLSPLSQLKRQKSLWKPLLPHISYIVTRKMCPFYYLIIFTISPILFNVGPFPCPFIIVYSAPDTLLISYCSVCSLQTSFSKGFWSKYSNT